MVAAFLSSVAGGMLLVLGASRLDLVFGRFVRLIGIVAFAVSVGIPVWFFTTGEIRSGAWSLAAACASIVCSVSAAAVIVLAPFVPLHRQGVRTAAVVGGASGIVASCLWLLLYAATPAPSGTLAVLIAVSQVLGSILIGSVTVAWMLGHAYLTATKMTITPLQRLSRMLSTAVVIRFVFLTLCVVVVKVGGGFGVPEGSLERVAGAWLILSLRVVVGLIALGGFAYMVGDCVKIRSTQSATGLLYFASVFVYIGELSSQHLISELGLPL